MPFDSLAFVKPGEQVRDYSDITQTLLHGDIARRLGVEYLCENKPAIIESMISDVQSPAEYNACSQTAESAVMTDWFTVEVDEVRAGIMCIRNVKLKLRGGTDEDIQDLFVDIPNSIFVAIFEGIESEDDTPFTTKDWCKGGEWSRGGGIAAGSMKAFFWHRGVMALDAVEAAQKEQWSKDDIEEACNMLSNKLKDVWNKMYHNEKNIVRDSDF